MLGKRRGFAGISCLVALLLMAAAPMPARCDDDRDSATDRAARVASDALFPFLAAGEASLLSGDNGGRRALRGAGAVLATGAATLLLKRLTHERRPDGSADDSFPSGHASLSFAMASVVDRYQSRRGPYALGAATLIALSRVKLRRHHLRDVVAGAGLGYLIGRGFARGAGGSHSQRSSARRGSLLADRVPGAASFAPSLFLGGAVLPLSESRRLLLAPRGIGFQMQW